MFSSSKQPKASTFNSILTGVQLTGSLSVHQGHLLISDGSHTLGHLGDPTELSSCDVTIAAAATVRVNQLRAANVTVAGVLNFQSPTEPTATLYQSIVVQNLTVESGGDLVQFFDGPTPDVDQPKRSLIVTGTLTVRKGGRISGIETIKAHNVVLESGGQLWGNIQRYEPEGESGVVSQNYQNSPNTKTAPVEPCSTSMG